MTYTSMHNVPRSAAKVVTSHEGRMAYIILMVYVGILTVTMMDTGQVCNVKRNAWCKVSIQMPLGLCTISVSIEGREAGPPCAPLTLKVPYGM